MTSVPEDIVRDILLKLPVKPLLRFKCLSKSWYSLISSPDFIKLHLHLSLQSYHHKKFVVETDFIESKYMIFDAPYISGESTSIAPLLKPIKHQYPFLDKFDEIVFSCDGLLLLKTYIAGSNDLITLWNPSTRESRELPTCGSHSYYGLGYDSSTDDYKVIRQESTFYGLSYQVFSLRSNSWRKIKPSKSDIMSLWNCFFINLNGALHLLKLIQKSAKIVCFTLAEETFIEMEMELPDDFGELYLHQDVNFFVLQGCLCLSSETIFTPTGQLTKEYEATCLNVWLMKEYGVTTSWTKFITIPHQPINSSSLTYPPVTPFCFKDKEVFIIHQICRNSSLVVYDLEKKDFHVIEIINGQKEIYLSTQLTFVESLVSL